MHFGMGSITRCKDVLDSEFEYCSDLNTTRFLRRMIEAERPDLIAFTGNFLLILLVDLSMCVWLCILSLK